MRALALGLALAGAVNAGARRLWTPPAPGVPPRLSADSAVETAALISLGMRRLAADLGLIRLLVYYGSQENQSDGGHDHEHQSPDPAHPELSWGGGHYPEIGPRARQILGLDPSFAYPVLYAAGALAFNLNRPEEALDVLAEALRRQPANQEYRAYVGAIGFHRSGDTRRVIGLLEPTLDEPDCPTMIKSMMAFLYRRSGRRQDAIRLYRDIIAHSRDAGYVANSRRFLQELGVQP